MPSLYTGLALQHLEIDAKHERFLFVEQFTIDSKLEQDVLNTYFKLKTFQLIYNHTEIYDWMRSNIFTYAVSPGELKPLSLILPKPTQSSMVKSPAAANFVEWFMSRIVVKGCAELWNISVLTKLDQQTASVSVSHTKLLLEQFDEKRSSVYSNRLANLLLNNRHWSTELMIESLWWSLGSTTRDHNLKKTHTRGSPFFLGVSLIKLSSYGNATKLDLSVHTLRTEYSPCLADFLLKLYECAQLYGYRKTPRPIQRPLSKSSFGDSAILVNAKITDITTFFFNHHDACILIALAEVSLARTAQITVLKLDGFQSAIMASSNQSVMNQIDFTDVFSNVKLIRMEYLKMAEVPQYNVYILNDSEAMWNTNLHMHIVTLLKDMKQFKEAILPAPVELDIGQPTLVPAETPLEAESGKQPSAILEIYAEGNTVFGIKISERHSMQMFLENFYLSRKDNEWLLSIEKIFINIDEMHIFTIQDVESRSASSLELLREERKNYDHFVRPTNRVWITSIGCFKGIFPYDHDFADAIQNEFNSTYKWLKVVHNIRKKEFTSASPLPADMLIQVKEFQLELSDDPFEVKLRDNYVLLVDEFHERLKRKNRFDQKITEICSERLLLPAGTIEELYANLVKKDSEIYIQRSKKINEAGPTRTRLIAWLLTDLQIMAMADPSIHGKQNVVAVIREIDSESQWPEEGLDFVTLWCRAVNISCSEWKFMLRDFPQPMFYVKQMRLFGNLCGAEQVSPPRAKRDVVIEIGEPFGSETIQRGMATLKFYHDFDCEFDLCSYAFGPCWEPVSLCMYIIKKIGIRLEGPFHI